MFTIAGGVVLGGLALAALWVALQFSFDFISAWKAAPEVAFSRPRPRLSISTPKRFDKAVAVALVLLSVIFLIARFH